MELKLISLLGWFTMIAVAWAISYNRKLFPWRTGRLGCRIAIHAGTADLKTPWGGALFDFAGKVIQKLIQFSNEGCKFVSARWRMRNCSRKNLVRAIPSFSPFSSWAPSSSSRAFRRCSITGAFCRRSVTPLRG